MFDEARVFQHQPAPVYSLNGFNASVVSGVAILAFAPALDKAAHSRCRRQKLIGHRGAHRGDHSQRHSLLLEPAGRSREGSTIPLRFVSLVSCAVSCEIVAVFRLRCSLAESIRAQQSSEVHGDCCSFIAGGGVVVVVIVVVAGRQDRAKKRTHRGFLRAVFIDRASDRGQLSVSRSLISGQLAVSVANPNGVRKINIQRP